ncbi:tyrosine-type recombinase/integrase [Duganella sp. FT135W]|uniref:Tyrosine-type recombinase/integrase n=1 Tax=Duganella flavida TaxID=2692175 RepID=A0A6L8KIT9_9BURK|nr:tyrosine-type recombinase/integrase [Duganella flavida]MYM25744.1 tyrosine-type recombinase/integrase [Duganella flavida]
MNRKRKGHRDLPQRVYVKFGAYYFVPAAPIIDPRKPKEPVKAWIKLCRVDDGKSRMHTELGLVLGEPNLIEGSMPHCIREFKREKIREPEYSKETVDAYGAKLDRLSAAFANFHATEPTTKDCADYIKAKYKGKANSAKKVASLMAKLFRFIIGEQGLRQDNPMDQLELAERTKISTTLPTHEQFAAIRAAGLKATPRADTGHEADNLSGPTFACIIDMTYLLWQRAIDIRQLKDVQYDGFIPTTPSKTKKTSGKAVEFKITPEVQEVIDRARAIKRKHGVVSAYLFPALAGEHKGHPYSKSGLSSMWRRAKTRAGMDGADIQFRHLRALAATDAARRGVTIEEIQKRLVHTSAKTSKVYIKEAIPEVSSLDVTLPWGKESEK